MPQAELNAAVWKAGRYVADYDSRVLEPAEVLLLTGHREAFTGRVLDAGCGAGRILGYLGQLGADVHGIDISPAMVRRCQEHYPSAAVQVGDLAALTETVQGPFDVVLLSDNVLDVFDDAERRRVLGDVRGLLAIDGLVVFSSHNLSHWDREPDAPPASPLARAAGVGSQLVNRSPAWMARAVARVPRRRANRRRLAARQYRAADHGVFNDSAHDYGLLHYYISGPAQARQLQELGLEVVEVLEFDGTAVPTGAEGVGPSLYYVARPR